MDLDPVDHPGSGQSPWGARCGSTMNQVRPGQGVMQSTGLVDQINPRHLDPPKIISQWKSCSLHNSYGVGFQVLVQLQFEREKISVFWANCFNSNKSCNHFIRTFVRILNPFVFEVKRRVKASKTIFKIFIVNLIYLFFVIFLLAIIRKI